MSKSKKENIDNPEETENIHIKGFKRAKPKDTVINPEIVDHKSSQGKRAKKIRISGDSIFSRIITFFRLPSFLRLFKPSMCMKLIRLSPFHPLYLILFILIATSAYFLAYYKVFHTSPENSQDTTPSEFNIEDVQSEELLLNLPNAIDTNSTTAPDSSVFLVSSYLNSPVFGGLPTETQLNLQILKNQFFYVGYDNRKGNPAWTSYLMIPEKYEYTSYRPSFYVDKRAKYKVGTRYRPSGYDRGHLVPNFAALTRYGKEGQKLTFAMTNIAPQTHKLNAGIWRELEIESSKLSSKYKYFWIMSGCLYKSTDTKLQTPLKPVLVPTHFFKIIIIPTSNTSVKLYAFLFDQNPDSSKELQDYTTSVDFIENASGIDFFPDLPDNIETEIESKALKWSY